MRPVAERARLEEAAGLKKAQAALVACLEEELAIERMGALRELVARRRPLMVGHEGEEIARDLSAGAAPEQRKSGARPLGIALVEQRQIEQPLARVIDDPHREGRRAVADLAQQESV